MDPILASEAFLIGLASGILATVFGVGGAILLIPAFRIMLGLGGHEAIATALPVTIPTSLAGAAHYYLKTLVKLKTAITCGIIGSVFSVAGAYATGVFTGAQLMLAEGALFIVLSYVVLTSRARGEEMRAMAFRKKAVFSILIGAIGGYLSGFFGIGAGAVLVPLLMRLRSIPMSHAVPTSLAIVAIYSVPGALAHLALGNIVPDIMVMAVAGALLGVAFSADLARKVDEDLRRKAFSAFLFVLGIWLIGWEISELMGGW